MIDADATKRRVADTYFDTLIPCVNRALDDSPTVDAVPVVRYKDCKYCDISLVLPTGRLMYTCIDGTHDHQTLLDPNDFCSRGERRKENVYKRF